MTKFAWFTRKNQAKYSYEVLNTLSLSLVPTQILISICFLHYWIVLWNQKRQLNCLRQLIPCPRRQLDKTTRQICFEWCKRQSDQQEKLATHHVCPKSICRFSFVQQFRLSLMKEKVSSLEMLMGLWFLERSPSRCGCQETLAWWGLFPTTWVLFVTIDLHPEKQKFIRYFTLTSLH